MKAARISRLAMIRLPGKRRTSFMPTSAFTSRVTVLLCFPAYQRLTYQRQGPRLAAAEFDLPDGPLHVDFFQFAEHSRGPALLALTGPWELNAHMRSRAKRSGLALSQEALKVRDTGELLHVPDEGSVFAALGIRYETPEERQRWVCR